jgi:hypothetical protein
MMVRVAEIIRMAIETNRKSGNKGEFMRFLSRGTPDIKSGD